MHNFIKKNSHAKIFSNYSISFISDVMLQWCFKPIKLWLEKKKKEKISYFNISFTCSPLSVTIFNAPRDFWRCLNSFSEATFAFMSLSISTTIFKFLYPLSGIHLTSGATSTITSYLASQYSHIANLKKFVWIASYWHTLNNLLNNALYSLTTTWQKVPVPDSNKYFVNLYKQGHVIEREVDV